MDAKGAVKHRIEMYIRKTGNAGSVRDFLVRAGLSPSYISGMSRGIGREARERIEKTYTDINVQWLDTGEGKMLLESPTNITQIAGHGAVQMGNNIHNSTVSIPGAEGDDFAREQYEQLISAMRDQIDSKDRMIDRLMQQLDRITLALTSKAV